MSLHSPTPHPFPSPWPGKLAIVLFIVLVYCLMLQPTVHAETFDIEHWRESLFQQYYQLEISFGELMHRARQVDAHHRGAFLNRLGVKDAGYQRQPDEADRPVRAGSTPTAPHGRGIFSDEDIECLTQACVQQFRQAAAQNGFVSSENSFFFFVKPLDLKVWKPEAEVPTLAEPNRFHQYAVAIALEPEYALGAKPGVTDRVPLESVLENLTKAQMGFTHPPAQWGGGYHLYEELIQTAKGTVRSLEAANLCQELATECIWLKDLRKMRQSPAELGVFSPGDSTGQVLIALTQQQTRMRLLMARAYQEADEQLVQDVARLNRQLVSKGDDKTLKAQAQATREALYRIMVRYNILFNRYPQLMQEITSDPTPYPFISSKFRMMRDIERNLQTRECTRCNR